MGLEPLARFLRSLKRDAEPGSVEWHSTAELCGSGPRSQRVRVSAIALDVSADVGNFQADASARRLPRHCTRRRPGAREYSAQPPLLRSGGVWRSIAVLLQRQLELSARCMSLLVLARALCVRPLTPLTGSSRLSGRPPSRCSRGAAARGPVRADLAPNVPPHPMRLCGARPRLFCGGGSRSPRGARRGRMRRALSACGR